MEREKIICIFCGRIAKIKEQGDLKIVICPKCKRETEMDEYQDVFDRRVETWRQRCKRICRGHIEQVYRNVTHT